MDEKQVEEAIIEELRREGGYATLDRLLYCSLILKEVGREKVLEVAMKSSRLKVFNETLYKYGDYLHKYYVISLPEVEVPKTTIVRKMGEE
jgi:hypothetical protein